MKVAFRVDASNTIGSGHLYRCLVLADELKHHGYDCFFITRNHSGNLNELIQSRGFNLFALDFPVECCSRALPTQIFHEAWLGVDYEFDAAQTIEICKEVVFDILIIDHYAIDYRWESMLRPYCKKIFVIDDLSDRYHVCDYLLDQNFPQITPNRYEDKNLLLSNAVTMLGPEYALLGNDYRRLRNNAMPRNGNICDVLIFFGGADSITLTKMAIDATLVAYGQSVNIHVVISANQHNSDESYGYYQKFSNVLIYKNLASLSELILIADLAIGGAGTHSWERCCLGLPALIVSVAENQIPIAKFLHSMKCVRYLGHRDVVELADLINAINLIQKKGVLEGLSKNCLNLVDGLGLKRVVDILNINSTKKYISVNSLSFEASCKSTIGKNSPRSTLKYSLNKIVRSPTVYEGHQLMLNEHTTLGIMHYFFQQVDVSWTLTFEDLLGIENTLTQIEKYSQSLLLFRKNRVGTLKFNIEAIGISLNEQLPTISICADEDSWINFYIPELIIELVNLGYKVNWSNSLDDLMPGDVCFYLAFKKKVNERHRSKFKNNIVIHESDLPMGKGWSPMTYSILNGDNHIVISMIEMAEKIDSGVVYMKDSINLLGYELSDEWRKILGRKTVDMCRSFLEMYPAVLKSAKQQIGAESYFPRRNPEDSRINIEDNLSNQFNLLRVVDNINYPAFFEIYGRRYYLYIKESHDN